MALIPRYQDFRWMSAPEAGCQLAGLGFYIWVLGFFALYYTPRSSSQRAKNFDAATAALCGTCFSLVR
jgi:hypothetical protein